MERFDDPSDRTAIEPVGFSGYDATAAYPSAADIRDGDYDDVFDPGDSDILDPLPCDNTVYELDFFTRLPDSDYEFSQGSNASSIREGVGATLRDFGGTYKDLLTSVIRTIKDPDDDRPMVSVVKEADLIPLTPEEKMQAELAKKSSPLIEREPLPSDTEEDRPA